MSLIRRLTLTAVVVLFLAEALCAQSILTVAGGGTDDGQPATDISVSFVVGLALDSRGNLYFAEQKGNVIRRVAADGKISTVAGNGGAGFGGDGAKAARATLNHPSGVAVDTDGTVYIADTDNNRIRKVDPVSGLISTFAGPGSSSVMGIGDGGPAAAAVLSEPYALWLDRGILYVSETGVTAERVRRIALSTTIISTVAGNGDYGYSGDGGPATAAALKNPASVVVDSDGNVFIADEFNQRVRRVDARTGTIDTYAGGGTLANDAAEGAPASAVNLSYPSAVALDGAGNLLVAEIPRVWRIDKNTRTLSTFSRNVFAPYAMAIARNGDLFFSQVGSVDRLPAGTTTPMTYAGRGSYVGDGLPAVTAVLRNPRGVAVDPQGNLYIADTYHDLVRKVDARSGIMSTYAGGGDFDSAGGEPALQAAISLPTDVDFDSAGNLYIATYGIVYRVDAAAAIVTRYAGGGSSSAGDGLPATSVRLSGANGIAFDNDDSLYIAEANFSSPRVWRVDARTHLINVFAGNGSSGYSGDGGPATAASLDYPKDVAVDRQGNVYIADSLNAVIRRVGRDGIITTFAGIGFHTFPGFGDGGPATRAFVDPGYLAVDPQRGDLYVADDFLSRIRKIDAQTGIITTVAGISTYIDEGGFSGDNGPAKDAELNFPVEGGVAVDARGNVYIGDTNNNRIRAVFACVTVNAPTLTAPANGATGTADALLLTWTAVPGAFRYDVSLDTMSPPARVIASDLTSTSFTPANLKPATKYFWSVTAKGDTFCPTVSKATSSIAAFTTAAPCAAGGFDINAPAEGATNVPGSPVQLSWQPSAGAGSYDVYLGPNNPPPLVASGIPATTYSTRVVDRNLFWFVVAHAACDGTKTAATPVHAFTTSVQRVCGTTGTVTQTSPSSNATGVGTSVDLNWSVAGGEQPDTFDLYFGNTSTPPLLRSALSGDTRSVSLSQLSEGTTYYWRLVAKGTCFGSGVSTPTLSFTTRSVCTAPGSTQTVFVPATVALGATYTIVWSIAAGLDTGGGYLVERSTSPSFASVVDSQVTGSSAASFLANALGTYYHRIRAVPSCDPTKSGAPSDVRAVTSTNAPANVIFTVQPVAAVTALGDPLEDRHGTFTLENIGASPVQVVIGQAELPGTRPFFRVAEGGAFVTLLPRTPRTFTIEYSGPPNTVAGSFQGLIFVAGLGQQLSITPYVFVNLKIGGGPASTPQVLVDGAPTEYVAFPGVAGDDDTARPGRDITIRNTGTTPMELGAEIGPEVWLVPENGWNAQPLPAGASRTIKLFTRRAFAAAGSPLPRYTYLTIRTKDGASARLLVQDNDRVAVSSGRATALEVGARSFIVPDAVSQTTSAGRAVSRIRLTNNGGDSVQVELIYTPAGSDGFDSTAVKRAVILVPPNDVVTLIDPLVQLFGASDGAVGQVEVRVPRERLGLIAATASTVVLGAGSSSIIPVVNRGEGARLSAAHVIYLTPASGATTLTLAETSGLDHATVRIGTNTYDLPRYGSKRISMGSVERIDINVDAGGGSVIGLASVESSGRTMTVLSRPLTERSAAASVFRAFQKITPNDTVSVTTVVPVIAGSTGVVNAPTYKTTLGFVSAAGAATFNLSLYPAAGAALARTVQVPGGQNLVIPDAQRDLFNLTSPTDGNLIIQGPPGSKVYATLQTVTASGVTTPTSAVPLPGSLSEALTSAAGAGQRPLSYDGLEQSVDPSRGTRWMLLMNEVGGASGAINVRLYEATNRSRPIAEKNLQITANQQLKLDTVFSALGLDGPDRSKDRTNVEVVVTATSGGARISATAVSIDNKTGDTKMIALQPAVGAGSADVSFTAQQAAPPARHRGVRH